MCSILQERVMIQSALTLHVAYQYWFTIYDLEEHIDDLLMRFQNKALQDTIYRVGHDLTRKLRSDDRFMGEIHLAIYFDTIYKILKAMSYGLCFRAKDEEGIHFRLISLFWSSLKRIWTHNDQGISPWSYRWYFILDELKKQIVVLLRL